MSSISAQAADAAAAVPASMPKSGERTGVIPSTTKPPFSAMPMWTVEQTPADFLDTLSKSTKARWRQLYRPPAPPPSPDRGKAAFTLGGLIADGMLTLQAGDSQQFRNNNQDVLSYCRMLGLGEKITPRLMAQGKLAEMEQWADLRQELVDGHQELTRVLREQHDEDLAVLVDLGVWMRVLEISSTLAMEVEDPQLRPICIGSPSLLEQLRVRFAELSEPSRTEPLIALIGELLEYLGRHWPAHPDAPPDTVVVSKTHEKIEGLMRRITLK